MILNRKKWYVWSLLYYNRNDPNEPHVAAGIVLAAHDVDARKQAFDFVNGYGPEWEAGTGIVLEIPEDQVKALIPRDRFSVREWLTSWLFGRKRRIARVAAACLRNVQWADDQAKPLNGLRVLQVSDGGSLKSRRKLEIVCGRLTERGHAHPNWLPEILPHRDLLAFLKWADENEFDLTHGSDCAFLIYHFQGRFNILAG